MQLHLVASPRSAGNRAIIVPHGVLFHGNHEADIHRDLVSARPEVVGSPANLLTIVISSN